MEHKLRLILSISLICVFIMLPLTSASNQYVKKPKTNLEEISNKILIKENTIYVGGSGPNNYSKIQDAINDSLNGDTVYVFNDSSPYRENLIVNKSIQLVGENRNTTIIDGGERRDTITINVDGVVITGFTIKRGGWSYDGILINGNNSVICYNNFINDGKGIKTLKTNGNVITYNYFTDCHDAIYISSSDYNIIEYNQLESNYFSGIVLAESKNNTVNENVISGNLDNAIQSSYVGIKLHSSNCNIITKNVISSLLDNGWNGIILQNSNDNIFEENSLIKTGFGVYGSEDNKFNKNTVNEKPFILIEEESNIIVENAGQVILLNCNEITVKNVESSNLIYGVYLYKTKRSIVKNCNFSNCFHGIYLNSSYFNRINQIKINNCRYGIFNEMGFSNQFINNNIKNSNYASIYNSGIGSIIRKNLIESSSTGILFFKSFGNKISFNTIKNSDIGIYLTHSLINVVQRNNLIGNELPAGFYTSYLNRWVKNYWGESRSIPKMVKGEQLIFDNSNPCGGFEIEIPWFNFDFRPAKISL